jgi:basic membrane protein A and related proteins
MNRIIAALICLVTCFTQQNQALAGTVSKQQPLKVGFIMVESVHDWGWNWAHDQGRQYMEKQLQGQVQTNFVENVPETAEAERGVVKIDPKITGERATRGHHFVPNRRIQI